VAAALALLAAPGPSGATTIVINSGPDIKNELLRSDGTSAIIWEELAFSFALPVTATGDGLFRMFAGGDLNNITIDLIDVTAGPFGDRTVLGTFAFPISDIHFTACENPPHTNPPGCPVPETVPGGSAQDLGRDPVGDVEGRRNVSMFSPGTPGLVVPQSLLDGGTNLTISLFPRNDIYDLYIDRLELSYPSPLITLGDLAIYNFNFSGLTPPPPYNFMALAFAFAGFDAGESLVWQAFDGLNATGGPISPAQILLGPSGPRDFAFGLPGALDGVFSIGVSDVVGSLELSILAAAEGGDPAILNNAPIITRQGAIPEPATLSLLGFALAVIAACRRSQRKSVAGL
jgi:hypothetical protein